MTKALVNSTTENDSGSRVFFVPAGTDLQIAENDQARTRVAQQVNTELVMLNWRVGNRIQTEILKEKRGEYGKQIVESLAIELTQEYGRGYFGEKKWKIVDIAKFSPFPSPHGDFVLVKGTDNMNEEISARFRPRMGTLFW